MKKNVETPVKDGVLLSLERLIAAYAEIKFQNFGGAGYDNR